MLSSFLLWRYQWASIGHFVFLFLLSFIHFLKNISTCIFDLASCADLMKPFWSEVLCPVWEDFAQFASLPSLPSLRRLCKVAEMGLSCCSSSMSGLFCNLQLDQNIKISFSQPLKWAPWPPDGSVIRSFFLEPIFLDTAYLFQTPLEYFITTMMIIQSGQGGSEYLDTESPICDHLPAVRLATSRTLSSDGLGNKAPPIISQKRGDGGLIWATTRWAQDFQV